MGLLQLSWFTLGAHERFALRSVFSQFISSITDASKARDGYLYPARK